MVKFKKASKTGADSQNAQTEQESTQHTASTQEKKQVDPESVYHGFVLGILTQLIDTYEVRSNRESGHGRPDVLILPKVAGKPGVVMEFKVKSKKQTLAAAFANDFQ